ncbi:MAG: hypothetical protein KatS3mg110_2485 [Pirellulaceae bacterium]|nr:MAG: hypothetical protein KatS3mg110_2485 [Pirellulaceae bacterium]
MPDTRKHRGPHPDDHRRFAPDRWPVLRRAVADLSWLLTRGYSDNASLKLVGDRYRLDQRQRIAVHRCSCSDQALADRLARECPAGQIRGAELVLDGFNVLTTIEAALAGGILLWGRDRCLRDLAGMHGTYRKVHETIPALQAIGRSLHEHLGAAKLRWCLDRPVSNSLRLATLMRQVAAEHHWPWEVEVLDAVDPLLRESSQIVCTSDAGILDLCGRWFAATREVVKHCTPQATVVYLECERYDEENSV